MTNLSELQTVIDYKFNNENLLLKAVTHSSFANENGMESYERLEFLGDAVLELIVSNYLYLNFNYDAGKMSKLRAKLVDEEMLSEVCINNKIDKFVLVGNAQKGKISKSVLCDIFESILGAVFLDSGISNCVKIVDKFLLKNKDFVQNLFELVVDYKTELQELVRKINVNFVPRYVLIKESGPDHNKKFEYQVEVDGKIVGNGFGESKKEAQMLCAKEALKNYKN